MAMRPLACVYITRRSSDRSSDRSSRLHLIHRSSAAKERKKNFLHLGPAEKARARGETEMESKDASFNTPLALWSKMEKNTDKIAN